MYHSYSLTDTCPISIANVMGQTGLFHTKSMPQNHHGCKIQILVVVFCLFVGFLFFWGGGVYFNCLSILKMVRCIGNFICIKLHKE